jgi:hypothetical protein
MTLIKINRSSIRKNPDYHLNGVTQYLPGPIAITGVCIGEVPESVKDKVVITSTEIHSDKPTVYELHFNGSPEELVTDERIKWNFNQEHIEFTTRSNPEYLYEYVEPPLVKCSNCGKEVTIKEAMQELNSDEEYEVCPNCYEYNTFDIKYERISEVINELKQT